jgi:hypothetical protein
MGVSMRAFEIVLNILGYVCITALVVVSLCANEPLYGRLLPVFGWGLVASFLGSQKISRLIGKVRVDDAEDIGPDHSALCKARDVIAILMLIFAVISFYFILFRRSAVEQSRQTIVLFVVVTSILFLVAHGLTFLLSRQRKAKTEHS